MPHAREHAIEHAACLWHASTCTWYHFHASWHVFGVSASFSSTAGFGGAQESEAADPGGCRGGSPACAHPISCHFRCTCRMPCRARTCEAHARSVCASSVRWHALLGAQVPVRVPFFACTLFSMLRNDIFHMHAACHAKSLPCRRARPDLRADARSTPQARSDLVRREKETV